MSTPVGPPDFHMNPGPPTYRRFSTRKDTSPPTSRCLSDFRIDSRVL